MRRAFTLIELLIVVAIISITSGGVMAVIVGPVKEQVRMDLRSEMTRGGALFIAAITDDFHCAESVTVGEDGASVSVRLQDEKEVSYAVGEDGVLRRNGAALVPSVAVFSVEADTTDKVFLVKLAASRIVLAHPVEFRCDLVLAKAATLSGEVAP